jgi:hypothetical protein
VVSELGDGEERSGRGRERLALAASTAACSTVQYNAVGEVEQESDWRPFPSGSPNRAHLFSSTLITKSPFAHSVCTMQSNTLPRCMVHTCTHHVHAGTHTR